MRDTAELHAALLSGAGADRPGRYFGPGYYLRTREFVRTLRQVTGRALPTVYLPAASMLPVGATAGRLQRVWPFHIPAEYGAIYIAACATRVDEAECSPLGIAPRPVAETMADTVRWLHRHGLLTDRQAGSLAGELASTAR